MTIKRLVAERLDVLAEVLRHEARHLFDAFVGLQECTQVHGTIEDAVQILDVADALGFRECVELLLELLCGHCLGMAVDAAPLRGGVLRIHLKFVQVENAFAFS